MLNSTTSPTASLVVDVVPTDWRDLRTVAANLRDGDRAEAEAMGLKPSRALWDSYRRSLLCHTCFVDGEPAAVFGLGGHILGDEGYPWLATTPAIERIKKTFVRCARIEIDLMLDVKPRLVNWVDARYYRAHRLLQAIGFTLSDPAPFGPHGALFRKFERSR